MRMHRIFNSFCVPQCWDTVDINSSTKNRYFWIKKVSCHYISRQNWLQGRKWLWTIIQGHPGKIKLLFPQESVHVLNKPYRTDGETSRRLPEYSSMNTPVFNTTQVQATIELQQSLHLHYWAGLPPKNPGLGDLLNLKNLLICIHASVIFGDFYNIFKLQN